MSNEKKKSRREGTLVGVWLSDEELSNLDQKVAAFEKIVPSANRSDFLRLLVANVDLGDVLPKSLAA